VSVRQQLAGEATVPYSVVGCCEAMDKRIRAKEEEECVLFFNAQQISPRTLIKWQILPSIQKFLAVNCNYVLGYCCQRSAILRLMSKNSVFSLW